VVGRWSVAHPWTAIAAWLAAVAVLLVTGHLAGTLPLPSGAQNVGPSGRAEQMISRDFPRHAVEDVLFDSASLRVGDPAYEAAIRDVLSRIQATGRVTQIQSPLDPRFAPPRISATRHAALLQFRVTGSVSDSAARVVPALAAVQAAAADHPQIQIAETGDASINEAVNDTVLRDLHRAELLSFPITLVVLLIALGAVVAALLPLGLATMAILAAPGLVAITSRLSGVTVQATSVMLLIGLAVGVDYSVFYAKRQREERASGRPAAPRRDRGGRRHLGPFGDGRRPGRRRAARRDGRPYPAAPATMKLPGPRSCPVPAPLDRLAAAAVPPGTAAAGHQGRCVTFRNMPGPGPPPVAARACPALTGTNGPGASGPGRPG
jgi:uncharacterized membrane protein YdfJ with MMPL/SSD domain